MRTISLRNYLSVIFLFILSPALSFGQCEVTAILTDLSCAESSDGAIDITVTGGTAPYTFTWTDGTGSGSVNGQEDQTGLSEGTYLLTIKDNASCTIDTSFALSQPISISINSESSVNASCNGASTGSVTVTASGGTGALVYTLIPGGLNNGSGFFPNLLANTYTVSITDANFCGPVTSGNLVVTEPPAISISNETKTDITCNGNNNGSITITAAGGSGLLTYTLTPGSITNNTGFFNGLSGGAYVVQVSDANGCGPVPSNPILIVDPPLITIDTEQSTDVTCHGADDGTLTVTASGGTGTLTYTLNPGGITNNTGVFGNLAPNNYTVMASDANGCLPALSNSLTINEPFPIVITNETTEDISCNGANDGEISVTAIGGTGSLIYTLNPGGITNGTGIFQNLLANTYTVSITDNNSCGPTVSGNLIINEPDAISIDNISITDVSCNGGGNGTITVSASGGTGAVLIYTLNPGSITNGTGFFNALTANTYSISVTDFNLCGPVITNNIIVGESPAITIDSESSTNISCNGADDGTITIAASGGTGALTYTLNPGGITNATGIFNGLASNTYTVSVNDVSGCGPVTSNNMTITEPVSIIITNEEFSDISCNGAGDGTVTISAIGGSGGLIYTLTPGGISNGTGIYTNLVANTYSVSITDGNGCGPVISSDFTITEPLPIIINSQSSVDVTCSGGSTGSASISASGGTGILIYTLNPGGLINGTGIFNGLSANTYTISVMDASGCGPVISGDIIINEPPPIIINNETTNNISCFGANDGIITIAASGGTGTLTYTLIPGGLVNLTGIFTNLAVNNYTVNVTDANGCGPVISNSISITEPPILSINNELSSNITCNGANDGSITIIVSGGTPPYMYSIDGGSTYFSNGGAFSGLSPANYNISVQDGNGCISAGSSINLTEPAALSITGIATDVSCNGGNDGSVDITVSGGTAPFSFVWSHGATTEDVSSLNAGNYSVTVTDANGCTIVGNYTVNEPTALSITEAITDVSCNAGADGAINITVSGGTAPYTFVWSHGPTTEDISALAAGNYSVTVTDANGCTAVGNYTVNEPTALSITDVITDVSCNAGTDGAINITVSGGTAPYTFVWGHGPTTEDVTALAAGNYSVTVTDANGCTSVANYTISEPAALSITEAITNVSCNAGNDGAIDITVSGGTAPYSYSWSHGPTSEDVNGLSAGSYAITITDANGCTDIASYNITEPSAISITGTTTDVSCNSGSDGAIDISVSGGIAPYSFAWGHGPTTEDVTDLAAGNYTVTVSDANGCTTVGNYTVSEPIAISVTESITNISCNAGTDGAIDITVSGGTAPFTFVWAHGPTTEDVAGLAAGSYSVTITDANSCSSNASFNVTEPLTITIAGTTTDVSCNGGADGIIDITVSGGTSPYSFSWSHGPTTEDVTALSAGSYTVTVTDANSCSNNMTFNINEPTVISITSTSLNVSCNGLADGTINISAAGGTSPYQYSIDGGASYLANGGIFTGLAQGNYDIAVRDAAACIQFGSTLTITEPPALNISGSITDVSIAGGNDGAINITVTGGTSPYSYSWSHGPTTKDVSGLTAGTYTITVTDANTCSQIETYTINEPSILTLSAVTNPVSCNGGNDGAIDITVNGGVLPYSYTWTTVDGSGLAPGAEDQTNLTTGTYFITVMDNNGAVISNNYSVNQPLVLTISGIVSNVGCNAGADGAIDITVSGGTSPYSYAWSHGPTTEDVSGLAAGSYSVSVTDANACSDNMAFTITEPAAITVTETIVDVSCNGGNDGTINLSVSDGTPPYTYSWSHGPTTKDVSGLAAGSYTVSITDANACTDNLTYNVNEPQAISITSSFSNITCNGQADGSITIAASQGTAPYQYSIDGGSTYFANGGNFTSLSQGNYDIAVMDAVNCVQFGSTLTITEPLVISISGTISNVSCNGGSDGAIDANISGGTAPYSYSWSHGANTEDVTGLVAGTYTLVITDASSCTASLAFDVTEPLAINIVSSNTNITCNGLNDGTITIVASQGTAPYQYSIDGGVSYLSNGGNFTGLSQGNYDIAVMDAAGCVQFGSTLNITEPGAIIISANVTDVSITGGNDGAIDLTVNGGSFPYTYSWSHGSTTEDISGLTAGTYTVTVTDDNGCTNNASYIVTEPVSITITEIITNVSCNGGNDGEIEITVIGGTGPYTFSWSTVSGSGLIPNSQNQSGLTAATYNVVVTDANGITANGSYSVSEPMALGHSEIITDVSCYGESNGMVDITGTNGTAPYEYSLNGGVYQSSGTFNDLTAGTYTITIRDIASCMLSVDLIVSQPATALSGQITAQSDVTCGSTANGSVTVEGSGGDSPYEYSLNGGPFLTSGTFEDLSEGNYTVTIRDANNCSIDIAVTINTGSSDLEVSISDQANVACYGEASGSISVIGSGGIAPLEYSLNGGAFQPSGIFNGLIANLYTIVVRDANSCTSELNVTISEPSPIVTNPKVTPASCPGTEDGSIELNVEGGTTPYSFRWSNSATTEDINNIQSGSYSVEITDGNSCTYSTTIEVMAVGEDCLEIPTAFIPNDDGYNDTWKIRNIDYYPNASVEIFNRWGQLVYSAKDGYLTPWDGKSKGKDLPMDAYYYVIDLKNGKKPFTGNVTIIR